MRDMHAEFGGRGFSGFRNFTAFKFGKKIILGIYVIMFSLSVLVFVFFFYVMSLSLFCAVSFYVLSFYESFSFNRLYNQFGSKNRIGSKISYNAWKPILVGVASPVLEILPLFVCLQNGQNFPLDHGL